MTNNDDLSLIVANPDLQDCLRYLQLSERDPELKVVRTKEAVANEMGISRTKLWQLVQKWTENGTLEQARRMYIIPKAQAVLEAIDEAITRYPNIIRRQLEIAESSDSDFASNKAAEWVAENLVNPMLLKMMDAPSNKERPLP